uniref:Ribosomal protein S19 n=1 Tax=Rhopalocnemis phalloides TaxID=1128106 RepID=A0A8K1Y0R8_9MAGN|nr:ribosomal protein S19 [Rhopalocnemis phalloides]
MKKKIKIYNLICLSVLKNIKKKKFYIWNRSIKILPIMVGYTILIYNGNKHIPIYINKYLIGHKVGEFSITIKILKKKKLNKLNGKKK